MVKGGNGEWGTKHTSPPFLERDLVGAAQAASFGPLPCEGRGGLGRGAFRISPNHGHPLPISPCRRRGRSRARAQPGLGQPHDLHSPRPRPAMPRMPIRRLTVLALLAIVLSPRKIGNASCRERVVQYV